ncbi:hypothetical protein TREES_T100000544 [Tupaia chinensis]|uniref:Uncharacterized protein n=1 Tax=Tupaia chinensis TaxID=246437 RepID=L9KXZ0_TUPCH|nr:hypothetical protein TREES_T100000544 [Tupaia chinensis]
MLNSQPVPAMVTHEHMAVRVSVTITPCMVPRPLGCTPGCTPHCSVTLADCAGSLRRFPPGSPSGEGSAAATPRAPRYSPHAGARVLRHAPPGLEDLQVRPEGAGRAGTRREDSTPYVTGAGTHFCRSPPLLTRSKEDESRPGLDAA